jgi:hypothetical protein
MAGQKVTATKETIGRGWEDSANENMELHSRQKGNPKNVSKPGAEISYSQISQAGHRVQAAGGCIGHLLSPESSNARLCVNTDFFREHAGQPFSFSTGEIKKCILIF